MKFRKEQLAEGVDLYGNRHDELREHPTQKPVRLMRWCIQKVKAQTIFDPFMGSGTTGVATVKLGRKFIGVEIEPEYFDVACRRIAKALEEPSFFVEKPKLRSKYQQRFFPKQKARK